ncbi:uncharacterized protein LOC119169119 isoform X3 [Rhipicephalus microplus]|uniref:uncharacterized protein LOC119169119 isoform X3 n=1 Tax=Rhipicephalus microplus TaxID=6941 RepID=UPI003F6D1C40
MSAIDQSSHITAEEANERSPPRPSHAAEPERTPDTAEETGVDTCSNDDASATTSREQPPSKRSRSSRRQRTCEGARCVFFGPKDEPAHGGGWHVGNVDPRPSIALLAPAMQGINKRRRRVTLSPSFLQRTLRINAFV